MKTCLELPSDQDGVQWTLDDDALVFNGVEYEITGFSYDKKYDCWEIECMNEEGYFTFPADYCRHLR